MDIVWVAIALGDVAWISLAFVLGFLASLVRLPPLVGFLITGFVLNYMGKSSGAMLQSLADLGITLLLFTVGLKLDLRSLMRPVIWGTTLAHMSLVTLGFGLFIFLLALTGLPLFVDLNFGQAILIAFALSFSSTVFVVKVLEEKGEMKSRHGRISIGILIMQDLAAVFFLAAASGKLPSIWAFLLLMLIPLRHVFYRILERTGHGELLILYGLVLALGGAELFQYFGVKGDLGALIMGVLISTHPKSKELAESMLGFKDLFLVGFFLTIGMAGELTVATLLVGLLFIPLLVIKFALFLKILTRLKLTARPALFSSLNLSNYSEFGLIVAAIGVSNNWLGAQWLIVMAIALAISLIICAPFNKLDNQIYRKYLGFWRSIENEDLTRHADDVVLDTKGATIAVFGMGRVGSGAYDKLTKIQNEGVVGFDFDASLAQEHLDNGRHVIIGNPGDPEFWEKLSHNPKFNKIFLALPNLQASVGALEQIRALNYKADIYAIVAYPDEEEILREKGVAEVYNIYTDSGTGFVEYVYDELNSGEQPEQGGQQPVTQG